MNNRFRQIRNHFLEALECDGLEAQLRYAKEHCADDPELRKKLVEMLKAHHDSGDFLASQAESTENLLPVTEEPGTIIGRYKLLEQIGEGGFGVVFMAEQEEPVRRKVALKIIKPGMDTREVIARFEAERQALAIMDHPNIAKVLDAGATESGRPFFVMELVRGIPITALCDQDNLTTQQRLELFTLVCQAVQHAHQKGIIHRDIKPSNVLVTMHDETAIPKVIDFGVAKATNQRLTERTLFTRFAQLVGTPLYMSPEQTHLSGLDVDTRSDIYSLGVLLYELLTGTTPFDQQRIREAAYDELLRIIREEDPPRPSLRLSTLGDTLQSVAAQRKIEPKRLSAIFRGDLDWIVMKALEKNRTRRYETAIELAADIRRYLNHEPVVAGPPSVSYKLRKFVQRHKVSVLMWSMISATLILGCTLSTIGFVQASQAKKAAELQASQSEAIAEFLRNDLLGSADPWRGRTESNSVISFLDAASKQLDDRFADDPLVEASIRLTLGTTYSHLGRYSEAERHLKRCREILRSQQLGNEDLDTLLCMRELGRVYQFLGKNKQAEPLLVEAIEGMRHTLNEEDGALLYSMGWLSWLYLDEGRYEEAEQLQTEALKVIQSKLGPEHPWAPSFIYSIGAIYQAQKRFDKAEKLITEALDMCRRTRGDLGIETLNIISQLGSLRFDQERYQDAEQLLAEALEGRRKVLGEDHPDTLAAMGSLGQLYLKEVKLDQAEQLLAECHRKSRDVLGEEHRTTMQSAVDLSSLFYAQGKIDEAEALWAKTIELASRVLGDENPVTLDAMHDVGVWYLNADRHAEAETLLVKALEGRRRALVEKHPDTRATMGMLYFLRSQYYKAEPLLMQALENERREEGPRDMPPFDSSSLAFSLALLHRQQGQYDKAESLLVEILENGQRGFIEGHPDTVAATNQLIQLYEVWGKPQEAEQWRSRLPIKKGSKKTW